MDQRDVLQQGLRLIGQQRPSSGQRCRLGKKSVSVLALEKGIELRHGFHPGGFPQIALAVDAEVDQAGQVI
jgi:hypothetical protein